LQSLADDEDAEAPRWLSRCAGRCPLPFQCDDGATTIDARWKCDGEEDCVDGADEAGCQYHTCRDGQRVRADVVCDEYPHCEDGSDEEDCE
jgi:hypothetical protein